MKHLPCGRAVAVPAAARPLGRGPCTRPVSERRKFPRRRSASCARRRTPTKTNIVERLSQSGHPSVRAVLTALLEDRLYFRNSDQKVFIVKAADADPLDLIDPLSLKSAGSAPADGLTKIGTNNDLRRVLRTTLARFALSSPDASVRLDAVREMSRSLDEANVALLRERLAVETNSSVKKEIATGLALAALDGSDARRVSTPSPRSAKASARMCGTGWRCCSRNLPTAASPKATSRCGRPPRPR